MYELVAKDFPKCSEYKWCGAYDFNNICNKSGEGWVLLGIFQHTRHDSIHFLIGRNPIANALYDKGDE